MMTKNVKICWKPRAHYPVEVLAHLGVPLFKRKQVRF